MKSLIAVLMSITPLLYCSVIYGQTASVSEMTMGKSFIDGSVVYGTEFHFSDRVYGAHVDTVSNLLTVQLRGNKNGRLNNTGELLQYDINGDEILWTKKFKYLSERIFLLDTILIHQRAKKNVFLDLKSGIPFRTIKKSIRYVDSKNFVGLGYKFTQASGNNMHDLLGIDLNSGRTLWSRNVPRGGGWNDLFFLNDSTLMLVAGGLHSIHMKTGRGWSHMAVTAKEDYKGVAATNAVGLGVGLLTGTYFYRGPNVVYDLVSNTIIDSLHIYIMHLKIILYVLIYFRVGLFGKMISQKILEVSRIFLFEME